MKFTFLFQNLAKIHILFLNVPRKGGGGGSTSLGNIPIKHFFTASLVHYGQNCHCNANTVTIVLLATGQIMTVLISLFFPVHNDLIQLD